MDITEGKRSLMIIHALRRADADDKKRLTSILMMHTADENLRKEAINIIKKYGSVNYAKKVAEKLKRESLNEAEKILPPSKSKDRLIALANYLVERKM